MKKLISAAIIILLLTTFLIPGCGENTDFVEATLDKEFILAIGQTAFIESEDLKLTFTNVTDDSRCPRDAQCVWAGIANCVMQISIAGTTNNFALVQPGASTDAKYNFGDYTISFNLKPYPNTLKQIPKSDYRLHLTVRKNVE